MSASSSPSVKVSHLYSSSAQCVNRGFQFMCICGSDMAMMEEKEGPNVGRLVFKCTDAGERGIHSEKWWDRAVMEEFEFMKRTMNHLDGRMSNMEKREKNKIGDELQKVNKKVSTMSTVVCELSGKYSKMLELTDKGPTWKAIERRFVGVKEKLLNVQKMWLKETFVLLIVCLVLSLFANIYFMKN